MRNRVCRRSMCCLLLSAAVAISVFADDRAAGQATMGADSLHHRGVNYQSLGKHDLAIADFNAALRIDPGYAYARVSRAFAYMEKARTIVRCRTSRPSYRLSTPTGIGTGTMHPLTTAAAASPYAGKHMTRRSPILPRRCNAIGGAKSRPMQAGPKRSSGRESSRLPSPIWTGRYGSTPSTAPPTGFGR